MNIQSKSDKVQRSKFDVLEIINTTTAAKNFAEQISHDNNEYTYLLNGVWGSGKTTFLEEVQTCSSKVFCFIDLWRVKDSRTVVQIAFSKLYPKFYWAYRIIFLIAVIITLSIPLNLEYEIINYPLTNLFFLAISVVCGLIQYINFQSDDLIVWLLNNSFFVSLRNNKVIVFDDFDRLDLDKQGQSYRVFNLLKDSTTIIFVADYNKISANSEQYLQKIIDRKIELPYVLHPSHIWGQYFRDIGEFFETEISTDLINTVISEKRNLRERKHFHDYVHQEFFTRKKLGRVQVNEQLWVIYIYLFHNDLYQKLIDNQKIHLSEKILEWRETKIAWDRIELSPLDTIINNIDLMGNNGDKAYPLQFSKNKKAYFLYESVRNMTVAEIHAILENEILPEQYILSGYECDLYQYVVANYDQFTDDIKNKWLNAVIPFVKNYKSSSFIRHIIHEKVQEIKKANIFSRLDYEYEFKVQKKLFASFEEILNKYCFDLSRKIWFAEKYLQISFNDLSVHFLKEELCMANNLERQDIILLTYLSKEKQWFEFEKWDEKLWDKIHCLSDKEFLYFFQYQGIISLRENSIYDVFQHESPITNIIVWNKRYTHDKLTTFGDVIKKISDRLEQLEEKGYRITRKDDDDNKSLYEEYQRHGDSTNNSMEG